MFYDINKLPTDGYIVMPLSMSRLANGQSPEECYEMIEYFEGKVQKIGIDGVFIYTNGLYFNADESAMSVRRRTNAQMIDHRNRLLKLIEKNRKYIPQSFHFLPWDYLLLASSYFNSEFNKLKKLYDNDEKFRSCIEISLGSREKSEANISFLIEEIVATHLLREKLIELPKTLVRNDDFRLVVYSGGYMQADAYQMQNKILNNNDDSVMEKQVYRSAQYNFNEKKLYHLDKVKIQH